MQLTHFTLIISQFVSLIKCDMQPFIVGGKKAKISAFPHAALISSACKKDKITGTYVWICGSSILNQKIVLTAGHCLTGCKGSLSLTVSVGHEHITRGALYLVQTFVVHDKYSDEELNNDIALVKLKTQLKFSSNVKRVVLMKKPPYGEEAIAAGWGLVNELTHKKSQTLRFTEQYVWQKDECLKLFNNMPNGTICARSKNNSSYVSSGDSGSALLVRGYIQIGLVSYKEPETSRSVVVYTDVGSHYEWIRKITYKLMCVF